MIDLHNEKNQLALFFLCVVYRGEKRTVPCVGRDVKTASYFNVIGRANARPITRRSVELSRTTGYRKSDNQ